MRSNILYLYTKARSRMDFFFFQAEDGIRDLYVTGVQTCALPIFRSVFNLSRFGPPRGLTPASTCPWVDHSVSGLPPTTCRPIQTRFRYGSVSLTLPLKSNSLARYAKSTPSQHEAAPTACKHTVSGAISLPFRGTFHLSLKVLVHYRSPRST